jgi:hypothetical protein
MKKYDWLDILFWFCVFVLAFVFGCSITSCSVLHKNKTIQKIDSVHVQKSHVDSSVNKDSFAVRKSQIENENSIVFDFGDSQIVVTPGDSDYNAPENKDYFFYDGKGFSTNRPIKKVSIRGATKLLTIDSTAFIEHAGIVKDWTDSSHVKSYTKDKEVKRSSIPLYWWLLLLLAVAYIVYRNRGKIKDFIIHITTGL